MNNYDDDNKGIRIDESEYGNYYRPVKRTNTTAWMYFLLLLVVAGLLVVWLLGLLNPVDKEARYVALINDICAKAKEYAEDDIYRNNIKNVDVPGKIVYIRIKDLVNVNLLGALIVDPRTGESIDINTDIRLKVDTPDTISCSGLAFPAEDHNRPTMTLIGDKMMYVNKGTTFNDPGVTATDIEDGDISENVSISGNLNKDVAGTYILTYRIQDRAGNLGNPDFLTRTVIVK